MKPQTVRELYRLSDRLLDQSVLEDIPHLNELVDIDWDTSGGFHKIIVEVRKDALNPFANAPHCTQLVTWVIEVHDPEQSACKIVGESVRLPWRRIEVIADEIALAILDLVL